MSYKEQGGAMRNSIVLAWLLLLSASPVHSQERRNLRFYKAFNVVIEQLRDDAIKAGLTTEVLRTDVELRLRKAGIRCTGKEELPPAGRTTAGLCPYVYVNVNSIQLASRQFAYYISVEVDAAVRVWRPLGEDQAGESMVATIWSTGSLSYAPEHHRFVEMVRSHVSDCMDRLVNDWLAVHPVSR